jgi:hypothetical protein
MNTTVWYNIEDKVPKNAGYYLAYKKPSFGDDSEGFGVYYYGSFNCWRESKASHSLNIKVSVWTDMPLHNPQSETSHLPSVAEIDAWKNVEDAISKYNMIKELSR